jgi:hypothetical protein
MIGRLSVRQGGAFGDFEDFYFYGKSFKGHKRPYKSPSF